MASLTERNTKNSPGDMAKFNLRNLKVGIVGLGYVGLPLAVEFGKRFQTVGFDIKPDRVDELRRGVDSTLEVESEELAEASKLSFTTNLADLKPCRVYIAVLQKLYVSPPYRPMHPRHWPIQRLCHQYVLVPD